MEQVTRTFNDKQCRVLAVSDDESLLLMDERHVRYEKENLSFTRLPDLFTFSWDLSKEEAIKIINSSSSHVKLESDDIESIQFKDDHYLVNISSDSVFYKGSFKITFKQ